MGSNSVLRVAVGFALTVLLGGCPFSSTEDDDKAQNDTGLEPKAESLAFEVDEDASRSFTLAGRAGGDRTLSFAIVTLPGHGAISGSVPTFTYSPESNYSGSDSFTFKANDGARDSPVATISITVKAVNDAPVAGSQSVATNEDTAKSIALAATDVEGDSLTYEVVAGPSHGALSGAAPNLTYTPSTNYNGSDSFTFKAKDGALFSDAVTVSIFVIADNDAPTADDQNLTTAEDTAKSLVLTASDTESSVITYEVVAGPSHGTLSGTVPNLTYTPSTNYNGSDSFTFKAKDGVLFSNVATISLVVSAVNDAPAAGSQTVSTNEDTAKSITLAATDVEGDSLTHEVVAGPTHGALSGTAPNLTYTPSANYHGSDSFTFKAKDGTHFSNVATISLTVSAVNDAPVAGSQTVSTNEDIAKSITLAANDVDGDSLTYEIVAGPSHGTLSGTAPNLTYTPSTNYYGSDSFTFKAKDAALFSNVATISLTVSAVNDAPAATAANISVAANRGKAFLLAGVDVESSPLGYAVVTSPSHGTLSGSAPRLIYIPDSGYLGADTITFKANDGQLDSSAATITFTVANPNPSFLYLSGGHASSHVIQTVPIDDSTGVPNYGSSTSFSLPAWGYRLVPMPDPGRFYVIQWNKTIAALQRSRTTGALSPVAGGTSLLNNQPDSVFLSPSASFAYVHFNNFSSSSIFGYDIGASNFQLSPMTSGVAAKAVSGVFSPAGNFMFAGWTTQYASTYSVAATGGLTAIPDSELEIPGGHAMEITTDPWGRCVYGSSWSEGKVAAMISSPDTGYLSLVDTPIATEEGAGRMIVHPLGKFLYVVNRDGMGTPDTVSAFRINSGTCALTAAGTYPLRDGATGISIHPSGSFLYISSGWGQSVSAFSIHQTTGELEPLAGSPQSFAGGVQDLLVLD